MRIYEKIRDFIAFIKHWASLQVNWYPYVLNSVWIYNPAN
jgi:hypothetical protein